MLPVISRTAVASPRWHASIMELRFNSCIRSRASPDRLRYVLVMCMSPPTPAKLDSISISSASHSCSMLSICASCDESRRSCSRSLCRWLTRQRIQRAKYFPGTDLPHPSILWCWSRRSGLEVPALSESCFAAPGLFVFPRAGGFECGGCMDQHIPYMFGLLAGNVLHLHGLNNPGYVCRQ